METQCGLFTHSCAATKVRFYQCLVLLFPAVENRSTHRLGIVFPIGWEVQF